MISGDLRPTIASIARTARHGRLNVPKYLESRGHGFRITKDSGDWIIHTLDECPFDSTHQKSAIIQNKETGAVTFKCFHDSCANHNWNEFRKLVGDPRIEDYDLDLSRNNSSRLRASSWQEPQADRVPEYSPEVSTLQQLRDNYAPLEFLVDKILVSGQHAILGGQQKTLKTSILMDLALSLSTATPFLNCYEVFEPVPSLVISGESGSSSITDCLNRICISKGGVDPGGNLHLSFELPGLSVQKHIDGLCKLIDERSIRFCAIDPAYLCIQKLSDPPINMADLTGVGSVLEMLGSVHERTGCTTLLVHHVKKVARAQRFDSPLMSDLSGAGFAEWARQWILIGRRAAYEHDGHHQLSLEVGGSAGHGVSSSLDVYEGLINGGRVSALEGRKWQPIILESGDEDSGVTGGDEVVPF